MDIQEKEAIEKQFERSLELLVRGKFPLTATAIVCAEQPMILLFKELIHRIEKREYELDKKDKRLKRQFKIITKRDKQIEEIKQIAHNDFEERCRLTFKLEELENELDKKDKIIDKLLTEITAVNSGRYEYMDNDEVLKIFTKKVEGN